MNAIKSPAALRAHRVRGVSLIYVLMALVVLSLASVALVRSVDTATVVLGNLGFKQDATSASDVAARKALDWLQANKASLDADAVDGTGYYATSKQGLDVTGQQSQLTTRSLVNWDVDSCAYAKSGSYDKCLVRGSAPFSVSTGATASYLILRMCATTGSADAVGNSCLKPWVTGGVAAASACPPGGSMDYTDPGNLRCTTSGGPFYRIVVRVRGPRNTTSFTETLVHL